jgi:hypothetical protein
MSPVATSRSLSSRNYLDNTVGGNLMAAGAICYEGIPVDCISWGGEQFHWRKPLPDQNDSERQHHADRVAGAATEHRRELRDRARRRGTIRTSPAPTSAWSAPIRDRTA